MAAATRRAGQLAAGLLLLMAAAGPAAQVPCEGVVERAEEAYYGGEFDSGIEQLARCLEADSVPRARLETAYALLGRLHFARGNEAAAREALRRLFAHAPGYRANAAQEEPAFVALIDEVRQEIEAAAARREQARRDSLARAAAERDAQRPGPGNQGAERRRSPLPWVLAGVGAAAAGAAVLLLSGGEDPPANACDGPTVLSDVEPNSPSLPQALSATSGSPIRLTGAVTLEPSLDEDFFSVRINSSGLSLSLTDLSADANLYFGDFDQVHLASERPGTEDEDIHANVPAGTYFIHVYPFQFGVPSISYTLNLIGDLDGCSSFRIHGQVPSAALVPAGTLALSRSQAGDAPACEAPDGIALRPGWNAVRNATGRPRDWATVQAYNDLQSSLWGAGVAWRSESVFAPGAVYQVFNPDGLHCLRLPPVGYAQAVAPASPVRALQLTAAIGDVTSGVRLDLSPEAAGRGEPAPPLGEAILDLSIGDAGASGSGRSKTAVLADGVEDQVVPIVLTAPAGSLARLRLEGHDPDLGRAALIELGGGSRYELTAGAVAHVLTEERQTRFVLAMGSASFVDQAARSLVTPAAAVASPNPFASSTTIRYTVEPGETRTVRVELFNLLGQRVRTLVDEALAPGEHEVRWDGTDAAGAPVPSATYICRITSGSEIAAYRVTLAR